MKRFGLVVLEVLGWVLGAGLAGAVLGSISYALAFAAGTLLAAFGVFVMLFRKRTESGRPQRLPNRWRALGVLWVASSVLFAGSDGRQEWVEAELSEARETGDEAYLQRLRDLRGEDAWMAALSELAPARYEEEQARVAEARRQREAEAQERRRQAWRDDEKRRVCDHVDRWLLEVGTLQYQADTRRGVRVLAVMGGDCDAEFREDGLVDVEVTDITVALKDYDNPPGMSANAVVRPDDPETVEEFERTLCRIAWGPYDWMRLSEC